MADNSNEKVINDLKKQIEFYDETFKHYEEEINLYKEMVENYQLIIERNEKMDKIKDFLILKQNMIIQMSKLG